MNSKLQDRGVRILCELTHVDRGAAERALDEAGGSVEKALEELSRRS